MFQREGTTLCSICSIDLSPNRLQVLIEAHGPDGAGAITRNRINPPLQTGRTSYGGSLNQASGDTDTFLSTTMADQGSDSSSKSSSQSLSFNSSSTINGNTTINFSSSRAVTSVSGISSASISGQNTISGTGVYSVTSTSLLSQLPGRTSSSNTFPSNISSASLGVTQSTRTRTIVATTVAPIVFLLSAALIGWIKRRKAQRIFNHWFPRHLDGPIPLPRSLAQHSHGLNTVSLVIGEQECHISHSGFSLRSDIAERPDDSTFTSISDTEVHHAERSQEKESLPTLTRMISDTMTPNQEQPRSSTRGPSITVPSGQTLLTRRIQSFAPTGGSSEPILSVLQRMQAQIAHVQMRIDDITENELNAETTEYLPTYSDIMINRLH